MDGSWQIIHPHWAFTAVRGHDNGRWTKIETKGKGSRGKTPASEGINIRRIDENYFMPHPDEFIYMCIAEKKEWQLLEKPWDLLKFCSVPRFRMAYFTSEYTLTSRHKGTLTSVNGKCSLEFKEKDATTTNIGYELLFDAELSKEKLPSDVQLPRTVFFETNGNQLRFIVRFSVVGIYKLCFKASSLLAEFRLEAKEKSRNANLLPVNPAIGFGFGHPAKSKGLVEPSHTSGVIIRRVDTREVTITFRMTTVTRIVVRMRHVKTEPGVLNKCVQKTVKDNTVCMKVTLPDDHIHEEYAIQIYTEEEKIENNVLNYLLTDRREDFEDVEVSTRYSKINF